MDWRVLIVVGPVLLAASWAVFNIFRAWKQGNIGNDFRTR